MGDTLAPVLVFGANLTPTAVVRSLAAARIPYFNVSEDPGFLQYSRFYRPLPGHDSVTATDLPRFLQSLDIPSAVLMPCADDWVYAIASLPTELARRFPASISCPQAIQTMLDKWQFATALQRLQLPHPRTELLESTEQLEATPEDHFHGAFFKPRGSLEFTRKHNAKGFFVISKQDALQTMRRIMDGASNVSVMLQEFIPGPPTNHYLVDGFMDRNGEIRALFVRHRLRMYPLSLGNSTLQESVPVERVDRAVRTIWRLLEAVGYRGIFSAEFKFDDRDGRFKILEVNARPWQSLGFATRSGINVCKLAYQDALGLPVDSEFDYAPGRRYVNLSPDASAFRELHRRGEMSFWSWLRSWITADQALLAWNDPKPGIVRFWQSIKFH